MIQPQDLRIGNWYEYNGIQYQVTAIEFDDVTGHADPPLCYIGEHLIHQINPIPLTEEVLVKCGFDRCEMDGDYWFEFCSEPLRLVSNDSLFNKGKNEWVIGFDYHDGDSEFLDNRVKHLHQLQNLYHALTGEELIYKP